MDASTIGATTPADLYLDLLKKVLTRTLFIEAGEDELITVRPAAGVRGLLCAATGWLAATQGTEVVRRRRVDPAVRGVGGDWPAYGETMVGLRRLDNLQEVIQTTIEEDVSGDLLEAGVWRGGASIFARAALEAYGDRNRHVWVADSFEGFPKPSMPEDEGDLHWKETVLAVSLERVQQNFARYGFLDERVHFLVGWFHDTLPTAPIEHLAILRLDADMYESTIEALRLYEKVSPGGHVIIDDYGAVTGCRRAVDDFRRANMITEPLVEVDWTCVYWRKDRER